MLKKRSRSTNWDDEEKKLLRHVLKEYAEVIENKCLRTNSIKMKNEAWGKVYKKFNMLNNRNRELSQLKIKWKIMKMNARKIFSNCKKEINKTGGGEQQKPPCDPVIEIVDLLNPAELLSDNNVYDSDVIIPSSSNCKISALMTTSEPCEVALEDSTLASDISNISEDNQKSFNWQDKMEMTTSENNSLGSAKKEHDEHINTMINHSKMLKNEEHAKRMQMAEKEHEFQIAILKEKLKCAILEREILEYKKAHEEEKE